VDGYLEEFRFLHEGMRQDQRERHQFLGFALAASGLVLGLVMRADPPLKPLHVFYLVGLVALVTFVAELLTLRSSQGVATAGTYLRFFVEPHVQGLAYQGRNRVFPGRGRVSSSRSLAYAYVGLTFAFVVAWAIAPIMSRGAEWCAVFGRRMVHHSLAGSAVQAESRSDGAWAAGAMPAPRSLSR
jgi:hypothetical protein